MALRAPCARVAAAGYEQRRPPLQHWMVLTLVEGLTA